MFPYRVEHWRKILRMLGWIILISLGVGLAGTLTSCHGGPGIHVAIGTPIGVGLDLTIGGPSLDIPAPRGPSSSTGNTVLEDGPRPVTTGGSR